MAQIRLFVLTGLLLSLFQMGRAQLSPWEDKMTISLEKEPAQIALSRLFQAAKTPFRVLPDVQGNVTIDAKDETFADVLLAILAQTNGIYDVIDKTIVVRPVKSLELLTSAEVAARPKGLSTANLVHLKAVEYRQADVQLVLKEMFASAGLKYRVDPKLKGRVTLSLRQLPFNLVLSMVLRQVNGAYREEVAFYEIVRVQWPSEN